MRTNIRERRLLEHRQREDAQAYASQRATSRGTTAAQKALRDEEKIAIDAAADEFFDDPDVFVRGAENPFIFRQRKNGRLAGAGAASSSSSSSSSSSIAAAKPPRHSNAGAGASSSSSSSSSSSASSAPALLPAWMGLAPGSIGSPVPLTAKDAFDIAKAAAERDSDDDDEDGDEDGEDDEDDDEDEGRSSAAARAHGRRGGPTVATVSASSTATASTAAALSSRSSGGASVSFAGGVSVHEAASASASSGGDSGFVALHIDGTTIHVECADGGDGYVRLRLKGGDPTAAPLLARLPASFVLPLRHKHRRVCPICKPSILEDEHAGGRTMRISPRAASGGGGAGRDSGTEGGWSSSAPGASEVARARAARALALDVKAPPFRELSVLHLQGIRYDPAPFSALASASGGSGGASGSRKRKGGRRAADASSTDEDDDEEDDDEEEEEEEDEDEEDEDDDEEDDDEEDDDDKVVSSPSRSAGARARARLPAASPAVIIGVDGYGGGPSRKTAGGAKYNRLAKLSRELGVALAVDPEVVGGSSSSAAARRGGGRAAAAAAADEDEDEEETSLSDGGYADDEDDEDADGDEEEEEDEEEAGGSKRRRGAAASSSAATRRSWRKGGAKTAASSSSSSSSSSAAAAKGKAAGKGPAGLSVITTRTDPSLDEGGYDATITWEFWQAYTGQKPSVNNHPDSFPSLAKAAVKFNKSLPTTALGGGWAGAGAAGSSSGFSNSASSSAFAGGMSGMQGGFGSSSSGGAGGGGAGGAGGGAGGGGNGAGSSSSSSSSSLSAGGPQFIEIEEDVWPFERWLIRKRVHYAETHGADTTAESPFYPDWVASNPLSQVLLPAIQAERKRLGLPPALATVAPAPPSGRGGWRKVQAGGNGAAGPFSPDAGSSAAASFGRTPSATSSRAEERAAAFDGYSGRAGSSSSSLSTRADGKSGARKRGRGAAGLDDDGAGAAAEEGGAATGGGPAPFEPWVLGARLDVRDTGGSWWPAQVVDLRYDNGKLGASNKAAKAGAAAAAAAAAGGGGRGGPGSAASAAAAAESVSSSILTAAAAVPVDGAAAFDAVTSMRIHYQGWPEEHDEWVALPPKPVLDALMRHGGPVPPAVRALVAQCRIAPEGTRSSSLSTVCVTCNNKHSGSLIFCDADRCGRAYHLCCTRPVLYDVPRGTWICHMHAGKGLEEAQAQAAAAAAAESAAAEAATAPPKKSHKKKKPSQIAADRVSAGRSKSGKGGRGKSGGGASSSAAAAAAAAAASAAAPRRVPSYGWVKLTPAELAAKEKARQKKKKKAGAGAGGRISGGWGADDDAPAKKSHKKKKIKGAVGTYVFGGGGGAGGSGGGGGGGLNFGGSGGGGLFSLVGGIPNLLRKLGK
jgi:hypothetical protein